ncbi:MAG: methyltransferase domain-containing protein [Candidatus Microsaccharimonas sp.]
MSNFVNPGSGKNLVIQTNLAWWDERAPLHATSKFYSLDKVIEGEQRLSDYEIAEVGPVKGKKLLHLQCHLGTESINWARLGAHVSGLDFSSAVIEQAKQLAKKSGVSIDYRQGDVYEVGNVFAGEKFDIAYVNIGSLHWLPDIDAWAKAVSEILNEKGILYVNEIHPFSSILGDREDNGMTVAFDYFNREPVTWNDTGSYADTPETKHDEHIIYDRPLSDILNAVIKAGLTITDFQERQGQEYQQFEFQTQKDDGKWYNPKGTGVFPSTFSLKAKEAKKE